MLNQHEDLTVIGDYTEAEGWMIDRDVTTGLWMLDGAQICRHATRLDENKVLVPYMLMQRTASGYDVTYTCAECVAERVAALKSVPRQSKDARATS